MAVQWIGLVSGVVATLVSAFVALRQARMDERLTRLNHDLDVELHERQARIDRELHAEDVLKRYKEPLAAAAFDLQSRLYNILELDFFGKFGGSHPRSEEALQTTMFRLAQYFGWTEILRRDIQFLSFPEAQETTTVTGLQFAIAKCFLTDRYGPELMIWSDEQRAIGERMIVEKPDGKLLCMGYASFRDACGDWFAPWCERLREELQHDGARQRMRAAQNLLCELVETLDERRVRYTQDLTRA